MLRGATNPTGGEVRLDLLALVGELAPGETLEIEVLVGDRARLPARLLLAQRVPTAVAKAGRTVRQRALALADALDEPALLCRVLKTIGGCLAAGCRVAKRRKEPGTAQQLLALTTDEHRKEAAIA